MSQVSLPDIHVEGLGGAWGSSFTNAADAGANFLGQLAQISSSSSILTDAAEEIGMVVSEAVEDRLHSEHIIEGETRNELIEPSELIAYMEATDDREGKKSTEAVVAEMRSGAADPTRAAQSFSKDPTQQYGLLQLALAASYQEQTPVHVVVQIENALARLEKDKAQNILANFNTATAALGWGGKTGLAAFQATYQHLIIGQATLADALSLIMRQLGGRTGEKLRDGIGWLLKALGADMSSARPSTDSVRLMSLTQDLYQLEVITTSLEACQQLLLTLKAKVAVRPASNLLLELVRLTQELNPSAMLFEMMADRWNARETKTRIAFKTGVRKVLRDMPPGVFPDAPQRDALLGAAQGALDASIAAELQSP